MAVSVILIQWYTQGFFLCIRSTFTLFLHVVYPPSVSILFLESYSYFYFYSTKLSVWSFKVYLEYFAGFEESRVLLTAEREQDVQSDPAVLLLEHEAVSVPGGPRGARGAAAALPASVLDQTLLPAAERRRLHRAVRLHVCGVTGASSSSVCEREIESESVCVSITSARRFKYLVIWGLSGDELRKYATCVWLFLRPVLRHDITSIYGTEWCF